ncbi:MAG: hypothetical protein IJN29_07860, partial [Akkermansia sp.]|nr:hypothetical protein [Akkermansia sp.]
MLSIDGRLAVGSSIPSTISPDALNVVEGGELNLSDGYGTQTDAIKDVLMTGGETNYSGTVVLDSMNISGGNLNLNDGTDSLEIDTLSVMSGGSITLTANSTETSSSAPITLGTTNGWTMDDGSIFNISFTKDYTNSLSSNYYKFTELVATGTVSYNDLSNTFALVDTSSAWKLEDAKWTIENGFVYITGAIYAPVTEVTDDESAEKVYTDISDDIPLEIVVSEDVTLSGDNSHSGGTVIDNVTVTLAHENALGDGSVTTKGTAGLETGGDTVANLPGTITIEDGSLTMSGKYKADKANLNGGQTESHDTEWFDVDSEEGNGFIREGGEAYRVVDVSKGTLNVDALDDVTVDINDKEYQLYSDGLAGEKLDYSTYYIKGKHEVAVSEILTANDTDTATEKVVIEDAEGSLTADANMEVQATAGSLSVTNNAKVTGSLANTTITAEGKGGEIAAAISGNSSVKATSGKTTLSGDNNTYTGGTTIDAAELIVTKDGGLGTGDVVLQGHGTLDLGNKAISNNILVKGCTLRGGAAYTGDMVVEDALTLDGNMTAASVTLTKKGRLSGGPLSTSKLDVQTGGVATMDGDLTILNGGRIILNNGSVLDVTGSLTLAGATTLELNGNYSVGTTLASSSMLTAGAITLAYNDPTVELEQVGNMLVLVSKFKQGKADAMAQANWGIATASRAFVNTVRGQRNNTGCIANGKGTAWFSLLGASNNLKGGDVSVEGAAVGADMKVGKCSVMGVAFGYTDGTVSPAGLRKVQQDGYYAALYGEHGL